MTSRAEMALSTGARIAFLLAVLLPAGMSRPAAETQPGRGGGLFLRVPLGARAVAMGESFVAPADDALSLFWNPAGLAPLRTPQIHTGHVSYFAETRIDSLAFNYPTLWGGLGLGTRWFTGSSIPRLRNGVPLGNFRNVESAMEMAMAVGKRNFSVGVLGRYYRHRIDDKSLDALMTDVGLLKSWRKGRYRIGFAAQNLGEDFGYGSSRDLKSPPPRQWRGGIAVRPSDNLLFAMDYLLPQHRQGEIHAGLELWLVRQVAFRSGYLWLPRSQAEALDPMAAWRFGMGLRVGPVELDYAYVPEQALGEMHHASLSYRFLGLTQLEEAGRVSMTVQPEFFSPNGDARRESAFFVIGTEGVEYVSKWAIEIRNSQSKRVRRFTGNGHPPGLTEWDGGLGRDTPAEEGEYLVQGRIWGRSSQALSKPVRVWLDRTPPSLRVEASTTVFSPDGDGLNDEVAFSLRAQDKHPLSHWKLEILPMPDSKDVVFSSSGTFENGISSVAWTGRSLRTGEPAANGIYEARFTAYDAAENASPAISQPVELSASAESVLEAVLEELGGSKTEDGYRLVVPSERIFDDARSSNVSAESLPFRAKILALAKAFPDYRLVINGRVGSESSSAKRTELSSVQAWALYSALVKAGLSALRLEVHGRGGEKNSANRLELLFRAPSEPSPDNKPPAEENPPAPEQNP